MMPYDYDAERFRKQIHFVRRRLAALSPGMSKADINRIAGPIAVTLKRTDKFNDAAVLREKRVELERLAGTAEQRRALAEESLHVQARIEALVGDVHSDSVADLAALIAHALRKEGASVTDETILGQVAKYRTRAPRMFQTGARSRGLTE